MKPSIPRGTRDFGPDEMVKRNYIFDTIRASFRKYGYLPLETPSMENLSTLMGKYGEEGDKLIFKILNSGNWLENLAISKRAISDFVESKYGDLIIGDFVPAFSLITPNAKSTASITEKALRYDLTVPFARYVVMHQNEITFPFKRYQIQPVWRADKPQKGRYREFYQCDADVIGTTSLLNELELIELFDEVFNNLGLGVKVQINNRKILSGIAEILGEADRIIDITVAIDKLDKIGVDKVKAEMLSKGVSESAVNSLQPLLEFSGLHDQKLELLKKMLQSSEIGMKGIAEIEEIFGYTKALAFKKVNLEFEMTLARGLNYYTGAIFEVKVDDARSSFTSSICGGGRYDDLTGIFGLNGMSGVGISFGADRIYDVLEEAGLFPADATLSTKVLIVNFGGEDLAYGLEILRTLRNNSVYTELYPDAVKMKKQMGYADARNIPFVILAGSDERNSREVTLKNMSDGTQQKIKLDQLADLLK